MTDDGNGGGGKGNKKADEPGKYHRLPEAALLACSEVVAGYLQLVGEVIESSAKLGQGWVDVAAPVGKTFEDFGLSVKKAAERFDEELGKKAS